MHILVNLSSLDLTFKKYHNSNSGINLIILNLISKYNYLIINFKK